MIALDRKDARVYTLQGSILLSPSSMTSKTLPACSTTQLCMYASGSQGAQLLAYDEAMTRRNQHFPSAALTEVWPTGVDGVCS